MKSAIGIVRATRQQKFWIRSLTSTTDRSSDESSATLWLAGTASVLLASSMLYHSNIHRSTQCEVATGHPSQQTSVPQFVSSSSRNPRPSYFTTAEEEESLLPENIPLRNITFDKADQLQNHDSVLLKSARAFDACLMTTPLVEPIATISNGGNNIHEHTELVSTKKMYFYRSSKLLAKRAHKFVLLAGTESAELGADIGHLLGVPASKMDLGNYADGETHVQVIESVRSKYVTVVCSTTNSDSIMELLLLVSALRRASAKKITVVIPYYGYSRQDETKRIREPIAAADIARALEELGVDQVMCLDLHNDAVSGFFSPRCPIEHLPGAPVAAAYFHEEFLATMDTENEQNADTDTAKDKNSPMHSDSPPYPKVTIVASHEGQVGRATAFRDVLQHLSGADIELAVLSRNKLLTGQRQYEPNLVGNVQGRKCILVDDIVNTGTTMISNVKELEKAGASSIYAWATHGVFGEDMVKNDAPEQLQELDGLHYLLISNSVTYKNRKLPSKIRVLNVAPLLAEAIARGLHDESISNILELDVHGPRERYDSI